MAYNWAAFRAVKRRCFGSPEKVAERALFHQTATAWRSEHAAKQIAIMMELALQAADRTTKSAAVAWLGAECNVNVIRDKNWRESISGAATSSGQQAA